MVVTELKALLLAAAKAVGASIDAVQLSHTDHPDHGDYATNIALRLTKELKKPPLQIATEISAQIQKSDKIKKVEVVAPGFINIFLSDTFLSTQLSLFAQAIFPYPKFHLGTKKKAMVEFAHPNTLKLFHIGHLRNIITGEALVRILEATGNTIVRANYQGDVGMHIAKTLWKLQHLDQSGQLNTIRTAPIREKITLIGKAYAEGNKAFESDETAKQEVISINKKIYAKDPSILPLWEETRKWSLDYFDSIYQRLNSHFDSLYFESAMSDRGVELCKQAVEKGILIEDQGAVIIPGEKYGVDRRVFINSLGLPTYEGKEMALAETEFSEHGTIDACIHLVTAEQSSYFAAAFKAQELMGIVQPGSQRHLTYGWVDVKGQKMSSRKGNVVEGEWLLNEAAKQIHENYDKTSPEIAETLAVAATKYAFLKNGLQTKVEFDLGEAVNLQGNSGPYLLYTYVRAQRILEKADESDRITQLADFSSLNVTEDDTHLIRELSRFPEVVEMAARTFAPNCIATAVYGIAQQYNLLYQKYPILKEDTGLRQFRLLLTKATAETIKEALRLLGIKTVDAM